MFHVKVEQMCMCAGAKSLVEWCIIISFIFSIQRFYFEMLMRQHIYSKLHFCCLLRIFVTANVQHWPKQSRSCFSPSNSIWVPCMYLKGRNFRGKKISRISAKFAKMNSLFGAIQKVRTLKIVTFYPPSPPCTLSYAFDYPPSSVRTFLSVSPPLLNGHT